MLQVAANAGLCDCHIAREGTGDTYHEDRHAHVEYPDRLAIKKLKQMNTEAKNQLILFPIIYFPIFRRNYNAMK